jgi:hypothetical protein
MLRLIAFTAFWQVFFARSDSVMKQVQQKYPIDIP